MKKERRRDRWSRARRPAREAVGARQSAQHPELLTGALLVVLLILLIGIARELPNPPAPSPPGIFTPVAYSMLVKQVQTGQVMAVNIQGNELNGLLTHPREQSSAPGTSARTTGSGMDTAEMETDIASFVDCSPSVSAACFDDEDAPRFPRERILYTLVLQQDTASLLSLLMSRHVVVNVWPMIQPPVWVAFFWKALPFYVFALLLAYLETGPRGDV